MTACGPAAVVSVGRLYCDLIFTGVPRLPTMGTEVFAADFGLHAGGGAAITAAHLAGLGRPAALAAILPGPPFGALLETELSGAGIDLSLCDRAPSDVAPQVTAALVGRRDRAFVTHRSGPATPSLTEAGLRLVRATHMHVGELATLVEAPRLVTLAREAGLTLSLDCGWDDAITADQAAPLIAAVDLFLPNADEFDWLASIGLTDRLSPLTVIKRGAEGAEALTPDTRLSAPAEEVSPVDTTGAGDAFNAGFLNAWLDNRSLSDCLVAGNRCGAQAIATRGGFAPAAPALAQAATR